MVSFWNIGLITILSLLQLQAAADPSANIWSNIATAGAESLFKTLQQPKFAAIEEFFSNQKNITFFLPNDAAIQAATSAGGLNLTQTNSTSHALMYHVISGTHDAQSLLTGRQLFTTESPDDLSLIAGPSTQDSNTLQVLSGIVTANVITKDIQCSNGIIHVIDHFLDFPVNTVETIAQVDELRSYNKLLTSQNLTNLIVPRNKTILAPNNEAWTAINGSNLPFGILTHDLKYEIIDGIYLSSQLSQPITLPTDYARAQVSIQRDGNGQLVVTGQSAQDTAHIVRADILTRNGIVHIVDKVLAADVGSGGSVDPSQTTRYLGSVPVLQPASETNKPKSHGSKTLTTLFPTMILVSIVLYIY
ncbi:hypothetical protein EC973_008441 [Apophysomyces ossiformis]|uniref:FAS1 domain-containing protein n=1 Tax=Apophysomyces ossiformis TaxID=679940 RepID=A0A8H7BTF3_9FUNG|nr:hypothetical protein EC973_008441 [Apophysomyces ossiformis]